MFVAISKVLVLDVIASVQGPEYTDNSKAHMAFSELGCLTKCRLLLLALCIVSPLILWIAIQELL